MEVKKAIRKVIALTAGATMLGATMFGALAASDLAMYPEPFVKSGMFDAFIVVGDKAAAEDVVGAVDIGASLQFEMKKEAFVSLGTADVMISDGVKIKGTGSEVLNYGEYLGDVRTTPMDDEDLPVMLAEGRYVESEGATDNDETYTQTLLLGNLNGWAAFDQPDDDLDAADYLELNDGELLYTYTLEFDDAVEYETTTNVDGNLADDIEGTQIEIQGNIYTITSVKFDSNDDLDDMTLMAGDTLIWLMQDQIVEKTVNGVRHEIKVVDVTDSEDSCGISVDGFVAWVDTKSDKTINGVNIGVLDAKAVHAQLQDVDICELNIGATEIKIQDAADDQTVDSWDGTIEVDGMDVDNAMVELMNAGVGLGTWAGIEIAFEPDDDVYLMTDQEFIDPVLGNFKVVMGGVKTERELIEASSSGSTRGKITFMNNDGKKVELPMRIDLSGDGVLYYGNGDDKKLLISGDSTDCEGTADAEDCDDTLLYSINAGNSAHVLEVTNLDTTDTLLADGTISLKDLTYGRTFNDKEYDDLASTTIDLGSLGYIDLTIDEVCGVACIVADDLNEAGDSVAETNYGAEVEVFSTLPAGIAVDTPTLIFELEEDDLDDEQISLAGARFVSISATYDELTDDQLEFTWDDNGGAPVVANDQWIVGGVDKIYDDSDVQIAATAHGTLVEWDENDDKWIKIWYPQEEVEVNAFIAPVSAQITTSGGDISTLSLEKINVGAARLASEISGLNTNMILVGGACANAKTAEVQGVSMDEPDCYAGLQSGEAVVKLYDLSTGKVAMVVAGMDAMDTRRATRVVSNFDAYDLSGMEVKVTGTSLTDIKVSSPS